MVVVVPAPHCERPVHGHVAEVVNLCSVSFAPVIKSVQNLPHKCYHPGDGAPACPQFGAGGTCAQTQWTQQADVPRLHGLWLSPRICKTGHPSRTQDPAEPWHLGSKQLRLSGNPQKVVLNSQLTQDCEPGLPGKAGSPEGVEPGRLRAAPCCWKALALRPLRPRGQGAGSPLLV